MIVKGLSTATWAKRGDGNRRIEAGLPAVADWEAEHLLGAGIVDLPGL